MQDSEMARFCSIDSRDNGVVSKMDNIIYKIYAIFLIIKHTYSINVHTLGSTHCSRLENLYMKIHIKFRIQNSHEYTNVPESSFDTWL